MGSSGLVKVEVIDRIIFSRWSAPPSKEDIDTVLKVLSETHQRMGLPLVYVGVVDENAKVADQSQRALLNDMLTEGRKYVSQCYMVIEGSALKQNLQRVIFSGMIIITRTFNDFMNVADSGEAIIAKVSKLLGKDAAPIIKQALEAGLITR